MRTTPVGKVMNKRLRWTMLGLAAVMVIAFALLGLAWWKTDRDLQRVFVIDDPSLAELAAAASPAHGKHLYLTRGCADCHASDGRGQVVFDIGPLLRVSASNITPAGLDSRYDIDAIAAAIRHGIRHDGRPLVFMPSADWDELSDSDTAALAAYVLALPSVDYSPEPLVIRPLARVLHLFGQFPLLPALGIDHAPRKRPAPAVAATARYGFYIAQVCTGCHGLNLAGAKVGPPSAPRASDLRRGGAMAGWTEDDFVRVMREGQRPDGSHIDPLMPWENLRHMTDVELSALWKYLETLPQAR